MASQPAHHFSFKLIFSPREHNRVATDTTALVAESVLAQALFRLKLQILAGVGRASKSISSSITHGTCFRSTTPHLTAFDIYFDLEIDYLN